MRTLPSPDFAWANEGALRALELLAEVLDHVEGRAGMAVIPPAAREPLKQAINVLADYLAPLQKAEERTEGTVGAIPPKYAAQFKGGVEMLGPAALTTGPRLAAESLARYGRRAYELLTKAASKSKQLAVRALSVGKEMWGGLSSRLKSAIAWLGVALLGVEVAKRAGQTAQDAGKQVGTGLLWAAIGVGALMLVGKRRT